MHIFCTPMECCFQLYVAVYFRRCDHHELLTPSGAGQLTIIVLTYFNLTYLLFDLNFKVISPTYFFVLHINNDCICIKILVALIF